MKSPPNSGRAERDFLGQFPVEDCSLRRSGRLFGKLADHAEIGRHPSHTPPERAKTQLPTAELEVVCGAAVTTIRLRPVVVERDSHHLFRRPTDVSDDDAANERDVENGNMTNSGHGYDPLGLSLRLGLAG